MFEEVVACLSARDVLTLPSVSKMLRTLPNSLLSLTFGDRFNQSMENVTLPNGLQSLTFGYDFNQSMHNVILPTHLKSLTFGGRFNQSMENVTLPNGLQSLTFGVHFNQSMDKVEIPDNCRLFPPRDMHLLEEFPDDPAVCEFVARRNGYAIM